MSITDLVREASADLEPHVSSTTDECLKCNVCNTVCPVLPNSNPTCNPPVGNTNGAGVCGFACKPGYHDNNPAMPGCEGPQCFPTGSEECDGQDNDCDGKIDEGIQKYCDKPNGVNDKSLCEEPMETNWHAT